MKSPSHFLRTKLKNAIDNNNNSNNNFNLEMNYVNSIINSIGSSLGNNKIKKVEEENMLLDKEFSALGNFKFLKNNNNNNNNNKNTLSINSSALKNTNININHSSFSSSVNSNKDFLNSILNLKSNRQKYLDIKQPNKDAYYSKTSKTPKANSNYYSKMNKNNEKGKPIKASLFLNFAQDYSNSPKCKRTTTVNQMYNNTNIQSYDYYKNNEKIFRLNENIKNELESKELKKKVNLMKKTIIQYTNSSQDLKNLLAEEISGPKLKKSEIKKKKEIKNDIDIIQKECEENAEVNIKNKSIEIKKEKYRKLKRIKELFDSFDDEEYEEENEGDYYISPSSYFIKIFDCIMFLSCMFYLICAPFYFSNNIILTGDNKVALVLLTAIDLIYILDIIINFFRAYHTFDENLVRKTKSIFLHYLRTWFLFDFIQAIPFFTFFKFLERDCINYGVCTLEGYAFHKVNPSTYLIMLIKIVKVYKMIKHNDTINSFSEFLFENEYIDNYGYFFFSIFYSLCFLNLSSCLYIFIGINSFPGWITKIQLRDESLINKYVASIYFIVVTITTVGYGDITGDSYIEIFFQMFLLIIGTLAYSFVISYISNYIVKKNQKSIAFEKNLSILKEIKLHNPNLKESIYQECIKNLFNEQLYERKDKSLLFDCLPYSLKNKLIMEMYKPFINNFVIFKYVQNADFIVKVVTSFKPLLSFKGDILIQEGDFIKEIFFVKKGVLSLNITIDRENIEESLRKYIDINELGTIRISYMPALMLNSYNTINWDENNINDYLMNKKKDKKLNINSNINIQDIKIIEIRKNEHFGDALMFLNERSPLVVKVKTKNAELLVLRKMEAIEIYSIYPNIWKKINKNSLYNMEQIKLKIKKEIFSIAKKYGSQAERNILQNSKSLKHFMSLRSFKEKSECSQNENKKKKIKKSKKEKNKMKYNGIKIQIIGEEDEINLSKNNKNNEEEKKEENKNEIKEYVKNNDILNEKAENSEINKNIQEVNPENKNNDSLILESQSKNDNKSEKENGENTNSKKIENKNNYSPKSSSDSSFSSNDIDQKEKSDKKETSNKKEEENKNININLKKKLVKHASAPLNFIFNNEQASNKPQGSTVCLQNIRNSTMTKSENIFFPTFNNLSKINEKSFELISSYENLNKITNNIYIKNIDLQSKTKQFLINECSTISHDSLNDKPLLNKNPLNGKVSIQKRISKKLTGDYKIDEDINNTINSLDLSKLKSKRNYENTNDISPIKPKKIELKNRRHESTKNLFEKKQSKNNLNVIEIINKNCSKTIRRRRKSELFAVNKKLNMITKNVKGANKNINNPEEFYMDFFNNIIKKETGVIEKFEEKNKNNNNNERDNSPHKTIIYSEKNTPKHKKFKNSSLSSDSFKFKKMKVTRKISKMNFHHQS